METVAKNMKGRINEMTSAFTELSIQYKNLSDEEKKSPFGQALTQSLDQLKTRIADSKAQLSDINAELGNTGTKGNETGGIMQQLAGKFTLTLDAVKLFNLGLKASGAALNVAKDAFFASEANLDAWNSMVYTSESVYNGFLASLNNGDISGYLSNINQIVTAAKEAYKALDTLATQKALMAGPLGDMKNEAARLDKMLQTGVWIRDPEKNSLGMKDGQKLTPAQLKALRQQRSNLQLRIGHTQETILGSATDALGKLYKESALRYGLSKADFIKGTTDLDTYNANMAGYERYIAFEKEHTRRVKEKSPYLGGGYRVKYVRDNAVNPDAKYRGWGVFKDDGELQETIGRVQQERNAIKGELYSMAGQMYRTFNRVDNRIGGGGGRSGVGGGGGRSGVGGGTHQETPEEKAAKLVAAALGNYENAVSTATLRFEAGMDNSEEQQKKLLDAQERLTMAYADAYNITQDENYKTKFGEEAGTYNQMADVVKGKRDLFNQATQELAGMDINPMEGILKQLLGEDMETFAKRKGIDLNADKGKSDKKEDKTLAAISKTINGFSGGLSQITGGLEQLGIDVPSGIERMISSMQAISTILTGINTVVMTIAALSAIPFAGGGIVHAAGGTIAGHHFSGDNVPALVNSGELILNRAQQGNIASQLSNPTTTSDSKPYLEGETIWLGMRNYLRRTGNGEIVTSKTAKRYIE